MKIIVTGRKFTITEDLNEKIQKKIHKLEKFFHEDCEAFVTLSIQKERHIVELTVNHRGMIFRALVENYDMYVAIDKAVEVIERQIRKNKTRLEKKLKSGAFLKQERPLDIVPDDDAEDEEEKEFVILKNKKFLVKPMSSEEAILQMNLLGHSFFVFKDASSNDLAIVYKRKDGNYGLMEPEI